MSYALAMISTVFIVSLGLLIAYCYWRATREPPHNNGEVMREISRIMRDNYAREKHPGITQAELDAQEAEVDAMIRRTQRYDS